MMNMINSYEAKSKFSQLIREIVNTKGKIVICKNGKPVVDIVYHQSSEDPLEQDPGLKGAKYLSDPCEGVSVEDWPEQQFEK